MFKEFRCEDFDERDITIARLQKEKQLILEKNEWLVAELAKAMKKIRRRQEADREKHHKTENMVYEKLIGSYSNVIREFKAEWCRKKRMLPFDFCIPEHNILIEIDGEHHFDQVSNWTPPEQVQERDLYKQNCAYENNYHVIRLSRIYIVNNPNTWFDRLQSSIQGILLDKETIHNIYLCMSNEYDPYIMHESHCNEQQISATG